MPRNQHIVTLAPAERTELTQLIHRGIAPARRLTRARILLLADANHPGARLTDAPIAAWVAARNAAPCGVDRTFTTADARRKLTRLYPVPVYAS